MIRIGIDASTTCTGFCVFNDSDLVTCMKFSSEDLDWRVRIADTRKKLIQLCEEYKPDKLIIEDIPLMTHGVPKIIMMLGCLQGSILGVADAFNIDVKFYTPTQWRSVIGLFDGSTGGMERCEMKKKSIAYANKKFELNLLYKSPRSGFNDDDIADAINVCWADIIKNEIQPNGLGRKAKI